jgi:hypothetical protein
VVVNYNHNDELIIGYGENFHAPSDSLKSTGKLVPGTFADVIVPLAQAGVPYEASVEIDLDAAIETKIRAEEPVIVNGRTYYGPLSVFSDVPLKGYAICPHGADKFTLFTLLTEEKNFIMKKNSTETKLSEEKDPAPSTDMKDAVRDQNLADMCGIFGNENGMKLWQSGGDIAEVKTWQSLNEKYAKYLPKADTALSDDDEEDKPTPPADDEPKDEDPPKKDDEEDKLAAKGLTKLTALVEKQNQLIESQSAEITKLKAAIPQGAEPVSHGQTPVKTDPQPKNSIDSATQHYKKS